MFVKEEYAGGVVQKLTMRKGEMKSYDAGEPEEGWVKIVMDVPARGLIGYMAGEFANDVHGQGLIYCFPFNIPLLKCLIIEQSTISSKAMSHSRVQLTPAETARSSQWPRASRQGMPWHPFRLEEPSSSTRKPKVTKLSLCSKILFYLLDLVYPGMVIGESSKSTELYLNPTVKKQLTNIRAAAADEKIVLSSPRVMGLEEAMAYMGDDEQVEITPTSIRLRKKDLEGARRGRTAKAKK